MASGPSGAKSTRRSSGQFSLATLNLVTGHSSLQSLPVFPSIARPRRSKSIFRCSTSRHTHLDVFVTIWALDSRLSGSVARSLRGHSSSRYRLRVWPRRGGWCRGLTRAAATVTAQRVGHDEADNSKSAAAREFQPLVWGRQWLKRFVNVTHRKASPSSSDWSLIRDRATVHPVGQRFQCAQIGRVYNRRLASPYALEKCDRFRGGFEYSDALFRQRSDEPVVSDKCFLRVPTAGRQVLVEYSLSLKAQPIDLDRLITAINECYACRLFRGPGCIVGLRIAGAGRRKLVAGAVTRRRMN